MSKKKQLQPEDQFEFRPMRPQDVQWIVKLEEKLPEKQRWSAKKIASYIQRPNRYPMVIELAGYPVAWILVAKRKKDLFVLRLECHEACEDGNYRSMLDRWVKKQAEELKFPYVYHMVREHDVDQQIFLKSEDYLYVKTYKNFYSNPVEDCYLFMYQTSES